MVNLKASTRQFEAGLKKATKAVEQFAARPKVIVEIWVKVKGGRKQKARMECEAEKWIKMTQSERVDWVKDRTDELFQWGWYPVN